MVAYQQGDAEAFDALVGRYQHKLTNYFFGMCYDRGIAEDLAQETFLRVIRYRARYKPEATFRTFLYAVARNLFIDHYRSRKAAPKAVSADVRVNDEGATIADLLEGKEEAAVERLETSELAKKIREATLELPHSQREVFLLVNEQGLKYREVAAALGVPVGTVKSRVNAALTQLRGRLGHVLG